MFDIILSIILLILFSPIFLIIGFLVSISSTGPIIYWSNRVGRRNNNFRMPKFRTMKISTPTVATHLLNDPDAWLTPVGSVLRRYSLDELPQLWSVLLGDMSFVGPRPALYNQHDLIKLRTKYGVDKILPGITGWAQVNGRDSLGVNDKVFFDAFYVKNMSFYLDIKILYLTFKRVISCDGVTH